MISFKWLYPGMHIKRWLLLLAAGVIIVSLGFAYVLHEVYNSYQFPDWVWYARLQVIPRYVRGVAFFSTGMGFIILAFHQLSRSLFSTLLLYYDKAQHQKNGHNGSELSTSERGLA